MDVSQPEELCAYKNLPAFLAARGFRTAEEPFRPGHVEAAAEATPLEVVGGVIAKLGNWEVVATAPPPEEIPPGRPENSPASGRTPTMVVFFVAPAPGAGKGGRSTEEMRKLLARAGQRVAPPATPEGSADPPRSPGSGQAEPARVLSEVLVFAPDDMLAADKAVRSVVKEFNLAAEARRASEGAAGGRPFYFAYPYSVLADDITAAPSVCLHEVVDPSDAEAYLGENFLKRENLPHLSALADPPAIWCGARPGDFVRVWPGSETAAAAVPHLRWCRPAYGYGGKRNATVRPRWARVESRLDAPAPTTSVGNNK